MKFSFTALLITIHGIAASKNSGNLRKLTPSISAASASSIAVNAAVGRGFQGDVNSQGADGGYHLVYHLSAGVKIQVKSNPRDGIIEIRKLGNPDAVLSAEDKTFLQNLAATLEADESIETYQVDEIGTQSSRAARLLAEWPETLPMNFDYTPDMDEEREPPAGGPVSDTTGFPEVPPIPDGSGRALAAVEEDTSGHHYRRLAYTSLCSYVGSYYQVTHDDFWYNNWADETTYYAWLDMNPDGPCSDGTYFWKNNQWQCFEPDHDNNIEYAYGSCFGRCGAGCGSDTQFTVDCANHDSCVRFGHSMASLWCDDEFSYTVDDALFAPNCY